MHNTMWHACVQVSREPPPPLPGGYVVSDKVYFTGKSETFESGDRLEHGKRGEVVGPATCESHRGKGVAVLFRGNKGAINCFLTNVRACRHPQLPVALADPLPKTHNNYSAYGRTGEPRAATAAAGRLRGG